MKVAEQVIDMAKFLLRCSSGGPLIKQLFEHIMFNPKLWINSEPTVQVFLLLYFKNHEDRPQHWLAALVNLQTKLFIAGASVQLPGNRFSWKLELPSYHSASGDVWRNVPRAEVLLLGNIAEAAIGIPGEPLVSI